MIRKDLVLINKLGLHARAASHLVKIANDFRSKITVEKSGALADAKSIMGLMLLAAAKGNTVTITADGEDEATALEAIENLVRKKFFEE